jgi:hypothetical protein
MSECKTVRTRKWASMLCLLAVVLLQVPFAQAAWMSSQMACCASGQCTIPSHHHQAAPPKDELPMQCGHEMSQMADCKMSCCKTTDETAVNVEAFVLPYSAIVLAIHDQTPGTSQSESQMISRSYKPLSPPPKVSFS